MLGILFRFFNHLLFRAFTRVTFCDTGSARQVKGGLVIVSNHLGFLDGFLIYEVTWRDDVIVPIAEHWQEHAWSRVLVRAMDAIFIDRYHADVRAVREVLRRLKAGGLLVLAPEGTRSPTGALIRAHHGAAYLAMKAGVPVVPAALTGTEDQAVLRAWKRLRRPRITITLGEPIQPPPLPVRGREQAVAEFTETLMVRIAALLPDGYRGIYRNHPQLTPEEAAEPLAQR